MSDRKSLIDKIKALLAKTIENGCTEFEMMSAMAKSSELMEAYHVEHTDLAFDGEQVQFNEHDSADHYGVRAGLAIAIAEFCDCKCWRDRSKKTTLTFCGLESDTVFAHWLLDMLADFVQRETTKYIVGHGYLGHASTRKRETISFSAGCVNRINQRLRELKHRNIPTAGDGRSLVVAKQAMIRTAIIRRGIVLQNRRSSRKINHDAYVAGKAAGNGAQFNRPVNSSGSVLTIGRS